jgi:hypothetical protein
LAVFVSYLLIVAATEGLVGPRSSPALVRESVQGVPLVALASACVLSFIILRSSWSGSRLAWTIGLVFFGVHTLTPELEALAWASLPPRRAAVSFFSGAVFAAIWAPASVALLGRSRSSFEASASKQADHVTLGGWVWMLAAGALWYLAVDFALGCSVASYTPAAAVADGSGTGLFCIGQNLEAVAAAPWLLFVELVLGALWTLIAIAITRMSRGGGLEIGLSLGVLFGLAVAVHLGLPNPALPRDMIQPHRVELALSNVVFGLVLGPWLRWRMTHSDAGASPGAPGPEVEARSGRVPGPVPSATPGARS